MASPDLKDLPTAYTKRPANEAVATNPAGWSFVVGDNNGWISPGVESVRQGDRSPRDGLTGARPSDAQGGIVNSSRGRPLCDSLRETRQSWEAPGALSHPWDCGTASTPFGCQGVSAEAGWLANAALIGERCSRVGHNQDGWHTFEGCVSTSAALDRRIGRGTVQPNHEGNLPETRTKECLWTRSTRRRSWSRSRP
jgi:hypothetical protein